MSCIHRGISCERPFLEPFVNYLNRVEGADFQFYAFLDKHRDPLGASQKQPEALYTGEKSGLLTIERKILSWPPNGIKDHSLWHLFFDTFLADQDEFLDAPYKLTVPHTLPIRGSTFERARSELKATMLRKLDEVRAGKVWTGSTPFNYRFERDMSFRDSDQPESGLLVSTNLPWRRGFRPEEKEEIGSILLGYLQECKKKFFMWGNTRKILLIEPHGSITKEAVLESSWNSLVTNQEVDEVWLSCFWDESFLSWFENWNFEKVYPQETKLEPVGQISSVSTTVLSRNSEKRSSSG